MTLLTPADHDVALQSHIEDGAGLLDRISNVSIPLILLQHS